MSAKRKDKKGRVLRTGESQRKDLTYQYRYQDVTGKRQSESSHASGTPLSVGAEKVPEAASG